jgi:hypothetical protein
MDDIGDFEAASRRVWCQSEIGNLLGMSLAVGTGV